jgi:hypothetical protein
MMNALIVLANGVSCWNMVDRRIFRPRFGGMGLHNHLSAAAVLPRCNFRMISWKQAAVLEGATTLGFLRYLTG